MEFSDCTFILFYEKCRLCLDKLGEYHLFDTEGLHHNVLVCTGVEVCKSDNLPQKICKECFQVIENAKKLRCLAAANDLHLKSLFNEPKSTKDNSSEDKLVTSSSSTSKVQPESTKKTAISVRKDLLGSSSSYAANSSNERNTGSFTFQKDSQDLISLLNSTQNGRHLLKQRLNPLGDQLRRTLTREIATEILKHDPQVPITNNILMHWIQEIKRVFPAENSCIYYTKGPFVFGRARGRLFDSVTNLKAKYRRNKLYQPRARRSLEKKVTQTSASVQYATTNKRTALLREDPDTTSESEADLDSKDTEIEECFEWLRSSADNYTLCDEKWAITRKRRQRSVLSEDSYPYLQEFPCLKRSWGYSLLIADFHEWYNGDEHIFENKFPLLKNKLISLFEKVSNKSKSVKELKELAKNPNQETSDLAALLMIPHLLGPVQIRKMKYSTAEVRESFIQHIDEERLLKEERQKRHDKNKSRGITDQPYVVVAGPLKNITARYIIVHDIVYDLPTIGCAVDTCFKIIWALYLEYPCECLRVWQFLQRAVYNLDDTKVADIKENISASVLSLLSDCNIDKK